MDRDWQYHFDRAREAHETLFSPQPAHLSGKQALARRTEAQRARLEAITALGEIADPKAAEALIDLLLLARHDSGFHNQILSVLRTSPVEDVAGRIAERALDLGVSVLAVRRNVKLLPKLEALIAEGEDTMPKHWCIAVCVAASYGHPPSRARLGELFGNPAGLEQMGWLSPMLMALVSGGGADAWECGAPVRKALTDHGAGRYTHVLVSAVGSSPDPDPRWAEVALQVLGTSPSRTWNWKAEELLTRLAKTDSALTDRLAALGTPAAAAVLATLGDQRAREPLMRQLDARSLYDLTPTLRRLRTLEDPPWAEMEEAVIRIIRDNGEVGDEELDNVLDLFDTFTDEARVDALGAAFDEALLISDVPTRKQAAVRERLLTRIQALRPRP